MLLPKSKSKGNYSSRRPAPKARTLVISESISQKSVSDAIKSIFDINRDDEDKEREYKRWVREPIQLVLNTFGGSVYDGLGLINAIELSQTPVYTYAIGSAMSMGLFILVSGKKRFIAQHATVMYHQIATLSYGKLEGIKHDMKEGKRLEKVCEEILIRKTKITKKDLAPYKREKKDWFITPKEALKLKIVDEILQ
jgi:ATP-dependent Clp protease protease subunit